MDKPYQSLPKKPGIYLFKDEGGQVLYVGKANNLKSRVSSYFLQGPIDRPWIKIMMGLIASIETTVVTNEVEALMLEATLIKQYQPKFNIKLTDDKSYPFIKLTNKEAFPRLQVVRQQRADGARYFGPYLSGRSANLTCEFLRKLYGVHISNRPIHANQDRPCLNCQLEGNLCPYAGEISEEKYHEKVESASQFLQGKRKRLMKDVEIRMHDAAEHENFELAAKLRDQLRSLEHITTRQQVISTTQDDYDAIATAQNYGTAVVTLIKVREGRTVDQKNFFLNITSIDETQAIIRQFLISYYYNFSDLPPLLVLSEKINDQKSIERWLGSVRQGRFQIRHSTRGDKHQSLLMAIRNAQSKLESRLLTTNNSLIGVIALKELLKLPQLPERIEAIDISNLGSSETVGASVCFRNGMPDKNEYRRYKIKTVEGQNDFAMIQEITSRRLADTSRPFPDILVIDGGKEQLKFALKAVENSEQRPAMILALAKKPDRIFLPGRSLPLAVTRGNKGLLLLARVRDEVHRFGINYQRHRQRKKSLTQ